MKFFKVNQFCRKLSKFLCTCHLKSFYTNQPELLYQGIRESLVPASLPFHRHYQQRKSHSSHHESLDSKSSHPLQEKEGQVIKR